MYDRYEYLEQIFLDATLHENAEQDSRDEANERAARPNTPRHINISDGVDLEEIDEYEDDEKIAVEMMAANGNSMDYRA